MIASKRHVDAVSHGFGVAQTQDDLLQYTISIWRCKGKLDSDFAASRHMSQLTNSTLSNGDRLMIVVENIIAEQPENEVSESDTVSLYWEDRQKCRQRLTTAGGRDIGLALPTGTILQPGDVLYRNEHFKIVVEGAPEKVFVLRPETSEAFGLVCYQIGNLHRPIGFHEGAILIPYEPVLEKQLNRLGFDYSIKKLVFTHAVHRLHSR